MLRTTYVRGPAKISYTPAGGAEVEWQSRGDIKVAWNEETFPITTDLYGKIDERIGQRHAEITFTPVGEFGSYATLWPLSNQGSFVGSEVFSTTVGTENILVISGRDNISLTFGAVALTKMPDLIQSAVKTLIGPVTFTAIGIDNDLWTVANSMWTIGAETFAAPTFTTIPTQGYGVSLGALSSIETAEGVHTTFDMQIEPVPTDTYGIIGYTYSGLAVSSRFQPVNLSMSQLLGLKEGLLQGSGAARGKSIMGASDLVVQNLSGGSGVKLTVKKAALKNPGVQWGTTTSRLPEIELIATLSAPGDPYFIIGTS
jgi:hypothetical protein